MPFGLRKKEYVSVRVCVYDTLTTYKYGRKHFLLIGDDLVAGRKKIKTQWTPKSFICYFPDKSRLIILALGKSCATVLCYLAPPSSFQPIVK